MEHVEGTPHYKLSSLIFEIRACAHSYIYVFLHDWLLCCCSALLCDPSLCLHPVYLLALCIVARVNRVTPMY